jgi:hypothetical protein
MSDMNGYFIAAGYTRSQPLGPGRGGCQSSIVCAGSEEEARKRFEEWLCAQREGETQTRTQIHKMTATPFVGQLLTETESVPIDWQQVAKQAQTDLESVPADDFDQGYWVDVNALCQPGPSLEALRLDLPEDVRSGLNWAEDKQFFFLLSALSLPPPPPELAEETEGGASEGAEAAEAAGGESDLGLAELEADFPVLADKEAAVLIRARNAAVAAWLWRNYAANTELAGNPIRIDPWCGGVGLEGGEEKAEG